MGRAVATGLVFLALATPAAAVDPVSFGPGLSGQGWEELTFFGRDPAEFAATGPHALQIRTDGGVSVIWRRLPASHAAATGAEWRWRVDRGVPPTDLSRKTEDDRDIALYFVFADDAAAVEKPPRSLRAALGRGRALIYVWGGDGPAGSIVTSPHLGERGKLLIQRPAGSANGTWRNEGVDLRADFRRAFDRDPGPLVGLAVSSDSDDTGSLTEASIADIVIR